MIMKIYSSYGVLDCEPMTLQAIEKSIPTVTADNQAETDVSESESASDSC